MTEGNTHNQDAFARAFWGDVMAGEEDLREERFPLVEVQTAIAWEVIGDVLRPDMRVLDAGGGTGRYSLPLAAQGHRVLHLDFSPAMLNRARKAARARGLRNIQFAKGDVRRLKGIKDRAHDLTLCLDAPISYAWPHHEQALAEVCRVTDDVLVLMVSSRYGVAPFMLEYDLSGEFTPGGGMDAQNPFRTTEAILAHGVEQHDPETRALLEREGKLTPPDYAFTIPELAELVRNNGFEVVRFGGPGALARNLERAQLQRITADETLFRRFIQLSLRFDFDPHNAGMGAVNILMVAKRLKD